jgi:hypothetical protein
MKKVKDNSEYFHDKAFSQQLRAQPRKSPFLYQKHTHNHGHFFEEDEAERHHEHRSEPAKNAVRVQLRRIQRLF